MLNPFRVKKTFDVSGTNSDIAMGNVEVYGDTTVQEILFNAILSAGVYTYKSNGFASKYVFDSNTAGNIFVYTAVSGTAGNTITWVLKATTTNAGLLGLGVTPNSILHAKGALNNGLQFESSDLTKASGITAVPYIISGSTAYANVVNGFGTVNLATDVAISGGLRTLSAPASDTGIVPLNIIEGSSHTTNAFTGIKNADRPILGVNNYLTRLLTILANGKVGIGISAPSAILDIVSTETSAWATQVLNNAVGVGNGLFVNVGASSTGTPFRVDVNSVSKFEVNNDGVALLNSGQLKFPATANPSADANTIDDYRKGTFTPAGAFGGGNTGMAFSFALGYYDKVGRKVFFEATLVFSAKGSSTGVFQLTGLPFSANSSSICVTSISVDKIVSLGQLSTLLVGGGTAIDLYQTTLAGANTAVDDTAFANDSVIAINGFYYV